jgi:hypothetical protein
MLAFTWAQEAPGLIGLLPRLESLRPLDAPELARLRVPGDQTRNVEASAEADVYGRPMTSHSLVSSTMRSPTRSCIGKTRRVAGCAGSRFFSGRLATTAS